MTPQALFPLLERCRDEGGLRRLDVAFARFLHDTSPETPASLILAAALLAQMEGRGHSGLPLQALDAACLAVRDGAGTDRARALAAALEDALEGASAWAEPLAPAFAHWPVGDEARRQSWTGTAIECDPVDLDGRTPLVLSGGLLYLRRYWGHEVRLARQIRDRCRIDDRGPDAAALQPGTGPAGSGSVGGAALPAVDHELARRWLARLFPPSAPATSVTPAAAGSPTGSASPATDAVDWQQVACAVGLRGRLTIVTGGPGTGKTYTAARLLVLMQALHQAAGSAPTLGPVRAVPDAVPPLRVGLAAPTGKAAARLRQSIQKALDGLRTALGPEALPAPALLASPATTLHALLGTQPGTRRFRHDATHPLELDVLFIDEASMVHLEMMAQVLSALPPQARLVLLGDKDQLASVEAGAVLGDFCRDAGEGYRPDTVAWVQGLTGQSLPPQVQGSGPALAQQTVVLRHSRRFDGPIGRLAACVNAGQAAEAMAVLRQPTDALALVETRDAAAVVQLALRGRDGAPGGYARYLERLAARPADLRPGPAFDDWALGVLTAYEEFRVLCAVREGAWGVGGLNAAIENALARAGLLRRTGEWYEGRPVMVTRNQPALGIFNGDIGIVLRTPVTEAAGAGSEPSGDRSTPAPHVLRAWFLDGDTLRSVSVGRLADVETAFAMTVHKSQGSEFAHVALVLPDEDVPVLTRELLYTGITRARTAFTLVGPQGRTPSLVATAAARRTRRVSGLRARIETG